MNEVVHLLSQFQLTFLKPEQLSDGYAIVGDGAYTVDLYQYVVDNNLPRPKAIYVRHINDKLPGELQKPEKGLQNQSHPQLILGTNSFHFEMLQRIGCLLSRETEICDLLMQKPLSDQACHPQYYWQKTPSHQRFVLIVTLYPLVTVEKYLKSFVRFLNRLNVGIFVRHPLQPVSNERLKDTEAVIFWNGSTPIFERIKQQCRLLNKSITFAECGFFPQHQHFYFDRTGVNLASQIRFDNLDWLNEQNHHQLQSLKNTFFDGVAAYNDGSEYIFVPLQVPGDSNVQQNSRFTHGMQEFIDFVLTEYQGQNIIFKAHPKDNQASGYCYGAARCLTIDTRSLVLGAAKVVGINSSVLYEAVLAGKPVDCHGNCLFNICDAPPEKVLCAMIARQFSIDKKDFSSAELARFSYLHEAEFWTENHLNE